ncbi:MAG: aromatic aminobenezylarsenical efflux permease ArsG family transporter, partial [Candidatus Saganbacteria bacterium]|nr:aromatic aminobenezylarsenical efflux permease ArsG family transporter [Candidatus Saganbacteria bacterium]
MFLGFVSALWLGIMTSISPCPLATNLVAISFLSKKIMNPVLVLISGIAYTVGRMAAYAILGFILVNSLLSVPQVAQFLQKYMGMAVGPLLITTGLILLEIFKFNFFSFSLFQKHHSKLSEAGIPGSFLLGFIFALAFCPVSAGLFFGCLIPLSLTHEFGVTLPFIYGIGTGLPVMFFAIAIATGTTFLSHWLHKLTKLELYMRRIIGII